jgi:hypothetical protein
MKPTRESKKAPSAESIARIADRGEDVSGFFTNLGKMMHPHSAGKRGFTGSMPQEFGQAAAELNVSRRLLRQVFLQ